jgi:hypothetical protein
MGGPLPSELYSLVQLRTLELSQGSFSGPLSESVAQLVNLDLVNLSNNTLTGTIPTGFDSLPFLGKWITEGRGTSLTVLLLYVARANSSPFAPCAR